MILRCSSRFSAKGKCHTQGDDARRSPTQLIVGCLIMASACASNAPINEAALEMCEYTLSFADEFDELSVAPRKLEGVRWTAHTPWNGDFGDASFSNPKPEGPFSVEDGILKITARRDETGRWQSGLLAAADASGKGSGVQYGYFEARMKLPPGPGTWPAFWLISLKPVADRAPKIEIDVIEYYGHADDEYRVASHVWYRRPFQKKSYNVAGSPVPIDPGSAANAFHNYGVRVTPEHVTYYFDRKPVYQHDTPPEHKTPLYPLINLALGSGYSIEDTPNPSVMLVDYVHVFAHNPSAASSSCG